MNATVERLPGEPILMTHIEGQVTAATVQDIILQSRSHHRDIVAAGLHRRLYQVIDTRQSQSTVQDVLTILKSHVARNRNSTSSTEVKLVFVGTHPLVKLYVSGLSMAQYGAAHALLFKDPEEALMHIRAEVKHEQRSSPKMSDRQPG